jgi:hypothetical protein
VTFASSGDPMISGNLSPLADAGTSLSEQEVEVSVVIPCLNEADTIVSCVRKAREGLRTANVAGEVIIADNGSADGSQQLASDLGSRVVPVRERGYGSALMGGIEAARGRFIIMGDADDSYDVSEIPKFVAQLRRGNDLVQGCRLPSGGGHILPGAMPRLHRWWGNPMFSLLARGWFGAPVHDIYCGLRGFSKELYERLDQRCTGMEFATEMIIKASLHHARIGEVPITLHPDGRRSHPPHLRTFRDGWRTLRFFLMFSPRWLFLLPGLALILAGVVGYAVAMPGLTIGRATFDAHTLLFATLSIICGYQAVLFALFTKSFAIGEGLLPLDPRMEKLYRQIPLERGLLIGIGAFVAGLALLGAATLHWRAVSFGPLDYGQTMRWVIPGVMLTVLGVQTIFSSFFISILGLKRRS